MFFLFLGDKWAQPREDNYTNRYDRMTKKNEPYSVFDNNLPGKIAV